MKTKESRLRELEEREKPGAPQILIYYSDEDRPPETDPETGRRRMLVEYDAAFRGL